MPAEAGPELGGSGGRQEGRGEVALLHCSARRPRYAAVQCAALQIKKATLGGTRRLWRKSSVFDLNEYKLYKG
jgi:hypothetical protein